MNAIRHFDEDDLAAYAMHLLAEPEASAVAAYLAANAEARAQLAEIEATLGLFAQGAVEMQVVPEGSMERFLGQITRERAAGTQREEQGGGTRLFAVEDTSVNKRPLLPWLGWAAAAVLAVTAGKLEIDRKEARQSLSAQSGRVPSSSSGDATVAREQPKPNDTTPAGGTRNEEADARVASLLDREAGLRRNLAKQAKELEAVSLALQQQQTVASDAQRERDGLQGQLQAKSKQVEELDQQARSAREVLDALTDRGAMRVLLTEPKQQPTPTGRATYVASRGTLVFQGSHLAPLEGTKVYELWILPADGSKPVPAGTFRPDAQGEASLVSAELQNAVPAKGFGVTVENEGGAQSPTLPILLLGTSGA